MTSNGDRPEWSADYVRITSEYAAITQGMTRAQRWTTWLLIAAVAVLFWVVLVLFGRLQGPCISVRGDVPTAPPSAVVPPDGSGFPTATVPGVRAPPPASQDL